MDLNLQQIEQDISRLQGALDGQKAKLEEKKLDEGKFLAAAAMQRAVRRATTLASLEKEHAIVYGECRAAKDNLARKASELERAQIAVTSANNKTSAAENDVANWRWSEPRAQNFPLQKEIDEWQTELTRLLRVAHSTVEDGRATVGNFYGAREAHRQAGVPFDRLVDRERDLREKIQELRPQVAPTVIVATLRAPQAEQPAQRSSPPALKSRKVGAKARKAK